MSLLNIEELKRQMANGTFTGLDDITNEFKSILDFLQNWKNMI